MDSSNVRMVASPPTDAAATQFYEQKVKPKVIHAFKADENLQWVSFTLLERDGSPILHVAAKNTEYAGWNNFVKTIGVVSRTGPKPIKVEVEKEELELLANQGFPIKPYALGRSVGIEGVPKGSGTLGGYITVTDSSGMVTLWGLTNNHVVNISPTTQEQDPNPHGVYRGNKIITPSQDDFKETENAYNSNPDPKIEIPKNPTNIGTLRYASGRTISSATPFQILDWALVGVSRTTYQNERRDAGKRYKVNSELSPPGVLSDRLPVRSIVPRVDRLSAGMRVFKYGRTTGWTRGIVSGAQETLNITEAESFKGPMDNPNGLIATDEWVAYNLSGHTLFCQSGDSGSWVLNEHGQLVGLLWGKIADRVFVTDIWVVIDSILALDDFRGKTIGVLQG